MKEYYTAQEAAEILKVTRRTVYRWIKEEKLKCNKTATGGLLIPADALLFFIGEADTAEAAEKN